MRLLNNIEEYALDFLTGKNDDIMEERINCFEKLNSVYCDARIEYLIRGIRDYELNNKNNEKYKELYKNCLILLENNKMEQLKNVFKNIEKVNLPKLYKYFFNKIKIKLKINEFNNIFPMCEDELDLYPIRKEINNSFDLEEDINVLEEFLLENCFERKIFEEDYLTNKISMYYYLLKVLKYELEILEDIKEQKKNLYENVIKIEKKILDSKKYNIPIKLKSGF